MKKFAIMLLTAALAISTFTACADVGGGSESKESSSPSGTESAVSSGTESAVSSASAAEGVDLDALLATVKESFAVSEQRNIPSDEIYQETGIEEGSYTGCFWLSDMSGLTSEKAVVFAAKDEAAAANIKSKLDTVLQSETAQMKDYNADNYAMLQKAVCEQKGLYVYLLVSPNVDKFAEAVNAAF